MQPRSTSARPPHTPRTAAILLFIFASALPGCSSYHSSHDVRLADFGALFSGFFDALAQEHGGAGRADTFHGAYPDYYSR
jgi:hypothetical protein